MKKIYMTPATDVVMIETIQMIAESFNGNLDGEGTDGGNAVSRGFDDWDE